MIERMWMIYDIARTTRLSRVGILTARNLLDLRPCFGLTWVAIDRVHRLCLIVGAGADS